MSGELPLPQCMDAEKGLLGSALLAPDFTIGLCKQHAVSEMWFHHPAHARIFAVLVEMRETNKPIDLISLTQLLEDRHILEEVGGAPAITELFTFVSSPVNAALYLEMMNEKRILRELIGACSKFSGMAYTEPERALEIVGEAESTIAAINESAIRDAIVTRESLLAEYLDDLEARAAGKKQAQLLPSPLETINNHVDGYRPGEETIIMGPTNSGKSMLGMEHVLTACYDRDMPAAIFTGEMPYRQYINRIISNRGRISGRSLKNAKLNNGEYRNFQQVNARLAKLPLEIYDSKRNALTLDSIEAQIRILKKKMKLEVVLIDYLQKLNLARRKDARRDEEVTAASSLFKNLAVELDLYIFVISATNDEGQVRESRGPEFDADNIISVLTDRNKVTRQVFIPKWRDGEKSYSVDVEIEGEFSTFRERIEAVKTRAA